MEAHDEASVLEQLHKDFAEAFRSNDPAAMGAFFSDSAVLLPPRRAVLSGKENVVRFWQNAQRMQDLAFEPTDVELLGDAVVREAGNLQLTMRGEGRDNVNVSSKYVAVWVHAGGSWKIDSLMWNGAAQGGAAGRGRVGQGGQGGGYGQRGGAGGGYGQRAGARPGGRRRGGGGGGQGGGGGYGGGGGRRRAPGGGQGQGDGGGYGQGGGAGGGGGYGGGGGRRRGPGGGGGGQGGGGGGGGGYGGGGFGRRSQRPEDEAPMVPRID